MDGMDGTGSGTARTGRVAVQTHGAAMDGMDGTGSGTARTGRVAVQIHGDASNGTVWAQNRDHTAETVRDADEPIHTPFGVDKGVNAPYV